MLNEQELGDHIDQRFTRTLFRLETLARYDVGSDGDDLRQYLDGEPGPDLDRKGPRMEHIRGEVARGLHTYRVHVVDGPLTDYLRFEFGAEITTDEDVQRYRAARDTAWSLAVPFADYWQVHPQYWRDRPAS